MFRTRKNVMRGAIVGAALALSVGLIPGDADAATQTGWTGATPPNAGTIYLHNSSITDEGGLHAKTRMWTSFGNTVGPSYMSVRTRLFKSGVMCEVVDYVYNTTWTSSVESQSNTHCGSGSYNSHGFVQAFDDTKFNEYVTFPSNPINYTAPATTARQSAIAQSERSSDPKATFTVGGRSYGPASQREGVDSPDFVAVYTDTGRLGYVNSQQLDTAKKGTSLTAVGRDGTTQQGKFTIK